MTQQRRTASGSIQAQILEQLMEVKGKVDESLKLSRENGADIRLLRTELGVDGMHGRLPQLEQALARIDKNQENDHQDLLRRVEALESGDQRNEGKRQLWSVVRGFLSGSLGAAVAGYVAKLMGLIH